MLLINAQKRAGHGIPVVSPITKKSHNQISILFVGDTNSWEGVVKEDDVLSTLEKSQQSVNSWGRNLLAFGGELRPDKFSYTVHRVKPKDNG